MAIDFIRKQLIKVDNLKMFQISVMVWEQTKKRAPKKSGNQLLKSKELIRSIITIVSQ